MMSCHLIPKWNLNADDLMMTWFTLYMQTLVTSYMACVMHVHVHGTHALCKTSTSKYLSGMECVQANLNLAKITVSHIWVLNTQNTNQNMSNMIPMHISMGTSPIAIRI